VQVADAAAPPRITRSLLERLPKAELHCHLDGSVRPATMLELAGDHRVRLPRDDAEALADYMLVRDARDLEEYLGRFEVTLSVMQTDEAIERIAYELAEDAAREGVRYIEVRFAPVLNTRRGLSTAAVVEAALRGLARSERAHGIVGRLIVCALRTLPPESSLELARLATDHRDSGVVGFDLAGAERGNPASAHAAAFLHAHEHGLPCTCHAGEGDGALSIADAIHRCCAQRIGHGTRLFEDPTLAQYVNDRRIPLEMCLTSNVQTRVADDYESHPFRTYLAQGFNVVLNTDNRLMSGVGLVDEYDVAARTFTLAFDDLARLALNGFESAFLPEPQRRALVAKVTAEIATLRGAP
jgi:adenosine deaminase